MKKNRTMKLNIRMLCGETSFEHSHFVTISCSAADVDCPGGASLKRGICLRWTSDKTLAESTLADLEQISEMSSDLTFF